MIKTVTKIGNSQGIIFDVALMDLAHVKVGDQLNVEVHEGGTLTLTPIRTAVPPAEVSRVVQATMRDYARTMKRLA